MTLDVHSLNQGLLVGCAVLLVAVLAVRASVGAGLPSLLLYLLIGVGIGEAGLGVQFSDAEVANALGFAALVVILAEGGLTTKWPEMRPVMKVGVSLATLGVAVSVGIVGIGTMVANATLSPGVTARVGSNRSITSGGLSVTATHTTTTGARGLA